MLQGASEFLNSLRSDVFWLLYIQSHLHVLGLHSIFFLVGLELAVLVMMKLRCFFCVAQIINTEATSTAFRAVVLYHSYIVYIKI